MRYIFVVLSLIVSGPTCAQPFSDNFDDGDLEGWTIHDFGTRQPMTTASSGSLRVAGEGVPGEGTVVALDASFIDPSRFINGSSSFEVTVDPETFFALDVRADSLPDATQIASFVIITGDAGSSLEIWTWLGGQTQISSAPFDAIGSRVLVEASWVGDAYSVTATNLQTLQAASVFAQRRGMDEVGGLDFVVGSDASTFLFAEPFGATVDNFVVVPAPATLLLLAFVPVASRRRRAL